MIATSAALTTVGVNGDLGRWRGGAGAVRSRAGLQPERTDLAWRRTALAASGCALVLLGVAVREEHSLLSLLPAVLIGSVAVVLAVAGRRAGGTPIVARAGVLAVVAILVTAGAALGVLLTI